MKHLEKVKYAVIVFFVVIFEMVLAKYLQIGGAVPMFTFIYCLLVSSFEKKEENVLFCVIFGGVMADLVSGHGFGTYLLGFAVACFTAYCWCDRIFSSKLLFVVITSFFMTAFIELGYYLLHISDIKNGFWEIFGSKVLGTALYNTVICVLVYPLFNKTYKKRGVEYVVKG